MQDISEWRLGIFAVCSLLPNVPAGLLLDQLLQYEYRFAPDAWEADGKPSGFLWCPPDAEWLYNVMRPFAPPFKWVYFKTPDWIRADRRLVFKLNLIRLLHFAGTCVALILFGAILF
jgi:hypothetical protein